MQSETALLWWWMNVLSRRRYELLRQKFGNLDAALAALSPEVLRQMGCKEETVRGTFAKIESFNPDKYLEEMKRRHVSLMSIEEEEYPALLKEVPDAPVFLSSIGDRTLLHASLIGIVGTRDMSINGKMAVAHFVPPFARSGMVTVSGLALGVDAEVARQTMDAGGKTIAVLGHGLAHVYPEQNAGLAEKIVKEGGLLLSEFSLEYPPGKHSFPARNRIIAGLSLGTLVIEAPEDSGSIITAELAADYNRDVFAVPGSIFDSNYAGCNRLIAHGQAELASDPARILASVCIIPAGSGGQRTIFLPGSPEEGAVYEILTTTPQNMDGIRERCVLETAVIAATLTMLELAGVAKNVGSGQWIRC